MRSSVRETLRMTGLVSDNLGRIRAARALRVSFLELVGSTARDDFDPSRSDIDVGVDFHDCASEAARCCASGSLARRGECNSSLNRGVANN